ncbi:ParB/RepB/Spo0J family partition protein [Bifidobacterium breve]|uniref:ParB/RepB/Spo0J family partition protein n=1 Tax=Bifidobacterium breve TaxID=1685 RepID=UPI00374EC65E
MAINIIDINVKSLIPNPNNPRRDVGDVTELADSIKEQGLQQALVVTPDHEEHGERLFRVVIGHRRLAACKLAGLESVPCVVRELDAKTERELMLVENCQRSDLTPLEEADGYQGLLDLGAGVGELAAKTGRSESFVRGRLRIARIPADVRSGSEAFAQLSLSQLGDLAEFEAYPDMMAELASMAGTKNWDWKRGQLRSRVRVEAWQQSMRTALEALGLTVDVSASTWTTPEGYRFYDVWSGEPDEFEKWYGQWREKNPYGGPVIRFSERTVLCFPQLLPEEIAERDAKSERREREQAAFQEALAARKEFDRLAYTLRTDWIRKHATGFNGGQLRKANTRLSLLALTGTNLCDGLIAGAEWNNLDHVLDAYNALTTPLPVIEDGDVELYCEQNLTELHRRQNVEGAANRELLLILCAQMEAIIDHSTWAYKDDITIAQAYYQALEDLGYPISDEENKALKGEYLPEDDEAE